MISPSSILKSSMKFVSLKSVKLFFPNVVVIFNLSAPGAAKFENPLALSYRESSFLAVINCSSMFKPTLYDGLFEYGSKTILSVDTSTKFPLIKYVPEDIPTAEPMAEAPVSTNVRTVSPSLIAVLP